MKFVNRIAGAAALGVALLTSLSAVPAQAGYVVTLEEVGSDVVATGSGPIDLTGLTFLSTSSKVTSFISAATGIIITGPAASSTIDDYAPLAGSGFTGPT